MFIEVGASVLPFSKKSQKFQNTCEFKYYCTVDIVYVYRITTSTAYTGISFQIYVK